MTKNQVVARALRKIAAAYEEDVDKILKDVDYAPESPHAKEMREQATAAARVAKQLNRNTADQKMTDSILPYIPGIGPVAWGVRRVGELMAKPARKKGYEVVMKRLQDLKTKQAEWRKSQASAQPVTTTPKVAPRVAPKRLLATAPKAEEVPEMPSVARTFEQHAKSMRSY